MILLYFMTIFLDFIKIKSRSYIKSLRYWSLQMNVRCNYVKCHAWGMINKGDIVVQKMKVKKINFQTPGSLISQSVNQCLCN